MKLFLSGPMGAGKSSVGAAIARRTGRVLIDLDERIAARIGKSVGELFRELGEGRFRQVERTVLAEVLSDLPDDAVLSLGGGTVIDAGSRRALLEAGTLITLHAEAATLASRVARDADGALRPLLVGMDARGAQGVLAAILRDRAAAYAEAHAMIASIDDATEAICDEILAVEAAAPIVVPLGERTYRVDVGRGVRALVPSRLAAASSGIVVVVTDSVVRDAWAEQIARALEEAARELVRVVLAPGEDAKHLASVEQIWNAALEAGVDRDSVVVGVGGGVVGDLAGFAASTLLRGIAFAQVPTTLLSMVDASVGGKTGFDREQGKNLIGTFHQPRVVVCDIETLGTLPEPVRRAGLAEVVKSAWLASEDAVAVLEGDADALRAGDLDALERAVRMSVALKASVVAQDEREGGRRRLLNLGHTAGHAFEAAEGFGSMSHGDAVARGLLAAFAIGRELGTCSSGDVARAGSLLTRLGLPIDVVGRATARALALLSSDKKRKGDSVRFIAPGAPGATQEVEIGVERLREHVRNVCA